MVLLRMNVKNACKDITLTLRLVYVLNAQVPTALYAIQLLASIARVPTWCPMVLVSLTVQQEQWLMEETVCQHVQQAIQVIHGLFQHQL